MRQSWRQEVGTRAAIALLLGTLLACEIGVQAFSVTPGCVLSSGSASKSAFTSLGASRGAASRAQKACWVHVNRRPPLAGQVRPASTTRRRAAAVMNMADDASAAVPLSEGQTPQPFAAPLEQSEERQKKSFLRVVWDFTRPHTIVGSVLSVISLHLFAATSPGLAVINLSALGVSLAWSLACAALVNLYVTGLNQVYDVDIDRVNKPYLPIPAGDLSINTAQKLVWGSLVLGTVPAAVFYPFFKLPLLAVTVGSALLGTIYSMPPFRLKRYPLLAAICIIVVRGTLINLGFYAHAAAVLGGELLPLRAWVASAFFAVFGSVIAVMKDVPDIQGDRQFRIMTFSVRLGGHKMLRLSTGVLAGSFAVVAAGMAWAALASAGSPLAVASRASVALLSAVAGWWVLARARRLMATTDENDSEFSAEVYSFYMSLWKLFYGSYLLLPFAL